MTDQHTPEVPPTPEQRRQALADLAAGIGRDLAQLPVEWFDPAAGAKVPGQVRQAVAILVEAVPALSTATGGLSLLGKHPDRENDTAQRIVRTGLLSLDGARHLNHFRDCPGVPEKGPTDHDH
ncbi:hypothetical protein [Streptomyces sp. NPDC049879]|uniref:hypothetical protein n=1 Tax=Streptomyces sp. NPDC049879 TaxID=3365598 RepID=UPI0037A62F10